MEKHLYEVKTKEMGYRQQENVLKIVRQEQHLNDDNS